LPLPIGGLGLYYNIMEKIMARLSRLERTS